MRQKEDKGTGRVFQGRGEEDGEKAKTVMYNNREYEIILPPKKIFLNEEVIEKQWDKYGEIKWEIELPEQGILFRPKKGAIPLNGFPLSVALDAANVIKRFIILKLKSYKNPLRLFWYKRDIEELRNLGRITALKYALKQDRYCRAVRALYRTLITVGFDEELTHIICSIFQWDLAYRYRLQIAVTNLDNEDILLRPRMEIKRLLKKASSSESNLSGMGLKWGAAITLLNILWIFPRFRAIIKGLVWATDIDEYQMDKSDLTYAFGGNIDKIQKI